MKARRLRQLLRNLGEGIEVAICCDEDLLDLHELDRVELKRHPLYPRQRVIVLYRKET